MNGFVFSCQLDKLRQGKLELQAMGDSGLTAYAATSLYELREYVKALEAGYRTVSQRLTAYRAKTGGKTIAELAENQWSEGACLGFAVIGMRMTGLDPAQTVAILDAISEAMEQHSLEEAAKAHQNLLDGAHYVASCLEDDDE